MVKLTSLTRTRRRLGLDFWLLVLVFCIVGATQATAQTDLVGRWSSVPDLPFFPVHAHVLPTGKVMIWPGDQEISGNDPRLWDPATATTSVLAKPGYDVFCTGHSFLADGRLFVTGGNSPNAIGLPNASIYNPVTDTWTNMPNMNAGRWYPTNTTLANGDVLVVSGRIDNTVGKSATAGFPGRKRYLA
jgi:Kelch motif